MSKRPPPPRRGAARPPAPARSPQYEDLLAIARLIESGSRFSEFRLRSGDIEVEVKRGNGVAQQTLPPPPPKGGGEFGAPAVAPAAATQQSAGAQSQPDLPPGTHLIKSPMVGTFYRSPEPGAKPFVEPGTKVKRDTIVCIIEVMKLMNSVEAGVEGTVIHVFAENAAMVEHDQPLIAIRP
jgi:acetyl-CoA carboxylase biotin carboxyl carrier protein